MLFVDKMLTPNAYHCSCLLQSNIAEAQQTASAKDEQLSQLSAELTAAQAKATELTQLQAITEEHLQHQQALLEEVGHVSAC